MFVIKYVDGIKTCGMLVRTQDEEGDHAVGGVTPKEMGLKEWDASDPQTVYISDTEVTVFPGWVHPDEVLAQKRGGQQ